MWHNGYKCLVNELCSKIIWRLQVQSWQQVKITRDTFTIALKLYLVNWNRTIYPCGLNEVFGLNFFISDGQGLICGLFYMASYKWDIHNIHIVVNKPQRISNQTLYLFNQRRFLYFHWSLFHQHLARNGIFDHLIPGRKMWHENQTGSCIYSFTYLFIMIWSTYLFIMTFHPLWASSDYNFNFQNNFSAIMSGISSIYLFR